MCDTVIFSTCWYEFKAKFDGSVFRGWIDNMLGNVNNYYLIVYTDESSRHYVQSYADKNPERIKVVIKPMEEFYGYVNKTQWILNHERNNTLKDKVDWRVNMLWAEKLTFVWNTIQQNYFGLEVADSQLYGWCDIGYFRGRGNDLSVAELRNWPNPDKIKVLNPTKLHYGWVNNCTEYMNKLIVYINRRGKHGLPLYPIPEQQASIGGGFFISGKDTIEWWKGVFYDKLQRYFDHGYLVKDDQMIIIDCFVEHMTRFHIHREHTNVYDNWFMFQRLLL